MKKTAAAALICFYITLPGCESPETGIITGNRVNLREKPELTGAVLIQLNKGDRVTVLDKAKSEWTRVKSGRTAGYVNYKYLALGEAEKNEFSLAEKYGRIYDIRLEKRELVIKDKKKNKILITTPVPAGPENEMKIIYSYYPLVYVGIYCHEEPGTLFGGLYDMERNEFIYNLAIIGMYFWSISPSKKYAAIDSGTGASARGLAIFDIGQKRVVLDTGYYPWPQDQGWTNEDEFVFYTTDVEKTKNLPSLTGIYNAYKERIVWRSGSVVRSGVITPAYME